MTQDPIAVLYQAYKKWLAEQKVGIYVVFRTDPMYNGRPMNRYITVKAIERQRFFSDVIVHTINGDEQLHNPIICKNDKEARSLCNRLNAIYVRDNEPENAKLPTWKELIEQLNEMPLHILPRSRKGSYPRLHGNGGYGNRTLHMPNGTNIRRF